MSNRAIDVLLSEKVLYPALGLVIMGALSAIILRPRAYRPAEDFSLPVVTDTGTLGTDRVSLAALHGHPVLIDFWATWCGPCRLETPILVRLHQRFQSRGLQVVGINVDEAGPAGVPMFRRMYGIDYPIVYDEGGAVSARYNVEGLPTLMLIDASGKVRLRHAGLTSESELAQAISDAF